MRVALCARLTGCLLLGCLFLYPSRVCGQAPAGPASSIAKTLSFSFPITKRQALTLSTEYVRVESFPDAFAEQLGASPTWKFRAVPITVGYAYSLTDPDRRIVPVVGVGVSYYLSWTRRLDAMGDAAGMFYSPTDFPSYQSEYFDKRIGMGYGAQATLGLRADLGRNLYVLGQGRARYVNGFGFSSDDAPGDFRAEFTKLDFTLGFGVKL